MGTIKLSEAQKNQIIKTNGNIYLVLEPSTMRVSVLKEGSTRVSTISTYEKIKGVFQDKIVEVLN